MDRRALLRKGLSGFATIPFARAALAQTSVPILKVSACSRYLQWLRNGDEVGQACVEMAFDALDVTVQSPSSHVEPARVKTALPPFVNAVRGQGVAVVAITCATLEADSPDLENILTAAAALGIKGWSRETYPYDLGLPLGPQIEALKSRIVKLARLSEKHGVKLMFRNRAGAANAGSAIFDLLAILKDLDPRHVGFLYDTGQGVLAGGIDSWTLGLRAAGPYVGGLSCSDAIVKLRRNTDEGGAFAGTPEQLNNFRPTPNRVNYGGGGQTNPWQAIAVPLGSG